MRHALLLGLLGLCITAPTCAAELPPSLFLTEQEQQRETAPTPTGGQTTLDALVYYNPGRWQLWLNGESFTPDTKRADIHILAVAPDSVTLRAQRDTRSVEFTLAPHQTYDWGSGKIFEGRP